jgi:hypothetical protein
LCGVKEENKGKEQGRDETVVSLFVKNWQHAENLDYTAKEEDAIYLS